MDYRVYGDKIFLRLDVDDEIHQSIEWVCEREKVTLGGVSGIGATKYIEGGFFDPDTKEYKSAVFDFPCEIASLTGNVTTMNGEVYLHLHASWTDADCKVYGGHLSKGVIGATGEIIIHRIDGKVNRKFSYEVGLNLVDMDAVKPM